MNLIEMLKSYKKTKSIREAHDICEYLLTLFDCELSCNTPEPLIKDEKIRKAVRAWAEANNRDLFLVINEHFNCCRIIGYTDGGNVSCDKIEFGTTIAGANKDYRYTIAELCGEEE